MMYSKESGRFPFYIVINRWSDVLRYNLLFGGNKLSSTLYNIMFQGHTNYKL